MAKKQLEITRADLTVLRGWQGLRPSEQIEVQKHADELLDDIRVIGEKRLRIGEHLARIRDVLEPRKMFERFLKAQGVAELKISRVTAYRYIGNYERARTVLPAPVMQVALMRNMDQLPIEMIKAFPPPRSADPAVIGAYLDKISEPVTVVLSEADQMEIAQRECFNFIRLRFERIAPEYRGGWMRDLCGMQLTLLGVGSHQQLGPVAVPESFRAQPVGRPRKRA